MKEQASRSGCGYSVLTISEIGFNVKQNRIV